MKSLSLTGNTWREKVASVWEELLRDPERGEVARGGGSGEGAEISP